MERRILFLAALLLLPPGSQAAGDAPLDRATLRGLKAVSVVIDVLDPEIEKQGVTREMVLTRLLARLQTDHIVVDRSATEFLGLRITAVRAGRGPFAGRGSFALSITLGLYQPVLLSRNHDLHTSTQTWEVETVLMADPKILTNACGETADDLSDRFATAWRDANPR